ncbi:MAG: thiol:disulfide interchange protein, partial [Bacteroidetes bacterium]|nr:thiol:disulfide interchange protein [Bacteroidota bacterium]
MKKSLLIVLLFIVPGSMLQSQIVNPVKWTYSMENNDNQMVTLVFSAQIDKPWHLYGTGIPEGGPIPLTIDFEQNPAVEPAGSLLQVTKPEIVDDPVFEMKVELHSHKAVFKQRIKKLRPQENTVVKGTINYMTCNDAQCVLNDTDFSFSVPASAESTPKPVKE